MSAVDEARVARDAAHAAWQLARGADCLLTYAHYEATAAALADACARASTLMVHGQTLLREGKALTPKQCAQLIALVGETEAERTVQGDGARPWWFTGTAYRLRG